MAGYFIGHVPFFSLSKKEFFFLKLYQGEKGKEFKTPINLIWQTSG